MKETPRFELAIEGMQMKRMAIAAIVVGLAGLWPQRARASDLPMPSITEMCESAELVVEGTWDGGDAVAVTRVWKSPESVGRNVKELKVTGLARLSRVPGFVPGAEEKAIETKKAALFLTAGEKDGTWTPLLTIEPGSRGVIWWDEKTCYGYEQVMNPGGYVLMTGGRAGAVPANVDAMRKAIEDGMAAGKRFADDLAIADPSKRADALVKYLLLRTSPDASGAHFHAAEQAVGKMGKEAVPALIVAIKGAGEKEEIHNLLSPLWGMGADAAAAKPVLLEVLRRKGNNAMSAIVALEAIGDPATAASIRPFLGEGGTTQRYVAARALAKLGDKESSEAIAALVLTLINDREIYLAKDVLNYLYALDPAKARAAASNAAADPAMEPVRGQIKALEEP